MQMLAFGQYNNIILNNTPNYLKIGTHVQNYKNNRKISKIFWFFDFSHLFSRSSAFEGPISAKFQMAIKSNEAPPPLLPQKVKKRPLQISAPLDKSPPPDP